MADKPIYYVYLHTNGELIFKPRIVVDSDPHYFDSPFVQKVWLIKDEEDYKEVKN